MKLKIKPRQLKAMAEYADKVIDIEMGDDVYVEVVAAGKGRGELWVGVTCVEESSAPDRHEAGAATS